MLVAFTVDYKTKVPAKIGLFEYIYEIFIVKLVA